MCRADESRQHHEHAIKAEDAWRVEIRNVLGIEWCPVKNSV
jgi:hypothetical protein